MQRRNAEFCQAALNSSPLEMAPPNSSGHDLTDHCEASDEDGSMSSALGKRLPERADSGLALDEQYSRQMFGDHVTEWWKHQSVNSKMITREKYEEIIQSLSRKSGRLSKDQEEKFRRYSKRYAVLIVNNEPRLFYRKDVLKATQLDGQIDFEHLPEVTHLDRAYDVIKQAHAECSFGGQHKTEAQLHKKFANIPRCLIKLYIDHSPCNFIRKKMKNMKEGATSLLPDELNTRGLVSLVDRTKVADGQFQWLMFYQDHHTKFTHVRALHSNLPSEVGAHLAQIFVVQGAPLLLHTSFGDMYTLQVLEAVREIWPVCRIIPSNPVSDEAKAELRKTVHEVTELLDKWVRQTSNPNWAAAVPFMMYQYNTTCQTSSNVSPYRKMYNAIPRLGVSSLHTTHGTLGSLQTEDQLTDFLQKAICDDNESNRSQGTQDVLPQPAEQRQPVPCFSDVSQFDFFSPPAEGDLISPESPISWPSSPF